MKRFKAILMLFLVLSLGLASGAELELVSEDEVYSEGENISFNVTAEPDNYTLTFQERDYSYEFEIQNPNSTDNSTNSTNSTDSSSEVNKSLNFTLGGIDFNDYVIATLENESVSTEEFFVGTGQTVFENVALQQDFPNVDDIVSIEAEVLNSDLDVQNASIDVDYNGSVFNGSMTERSADNPYFKFETAFRVEKEGIHNYTVTVNSNNSSAEYSSTFEVYQEGFTGDETQVTARISNPCGMDINPSTAPGGGLVPQDGTGSFLIGYERQGGYAVNVTGNLSVYYEGITRDNLSDGEFAYSMNMSYPLLETNEPVTDQSDDYYRQYNKTSTLGYYKGILDVNATCYRKLFDESYFEELGINYTEDDLWGISPASPDDDPFLNFTENITFRVAVPGGGTGDTGTPTSNQTNPADADQEGETSDQEVEGDSSAPGSTPEPQPVPDPVPEPAPSPRPMLSINIEDTEDLYDTPRGGFSPIDLKISNLGNFSLSDIEISPLIGGLGDWQTRGASIANLSQDETVNKTIFLRPPAGQETGRYRVPVLARGQADSRELDLQYIDVNVKKENFSRKVSIAELPDQISLQAGSSTDIPMLLENTGVKNVSNVSVDVQNLEQCGEAETNVTDSLPVNSSVSLQIGISASDNLRTCNTTVIVSTGAGAYTFADLSVEITPEEGIIPPRFRVPLIAILWTLGLISYAVARRRLEIESLLVKGPFVIMVMGEALIVLYLAVEYYSILPQGALPF